MGKSESRVLSQSAMSGSREERLSTKKEAMVYRAVYNPDGELLVMLGSQVRHACDCTPLLCDTYVL